MTSKSVALVTGASGSIGPSLVSRLIAEGYQVRTLSRRPPSDAALSSQVPHFSGEVTNRDLVERAIEGADSVFHLAALLHVENPGPELDREYQRVNVDGARLLAECAASAGTARFIYFSTVKVYGVHRRDPVRETVSPRPKTIYARTKLDGERAILDVLGHRSVVLRLSPVYGPRVKGSWARLISAIQRGRFVPIGSLDNVHSITHVDDVVSAAVFAAQHPNAAGDIFNLVAHDSPTLRTILTAIYQDCGRMLPAVRVPTPLALPGAYLLEKCLGLVGVQPPLTVAAVRQLTEDEAYCGAKLREMGFSPQIGIEDGWSL